ncbi:MAG: Transcriptional regulator, AsnC family, partial [uncultured Pseudonocardia sp.]
DHDGPRGHTEPGRRRAARRDGRGHRRAVADRRAPLLRGHRQGDRPVRGGGPAAGATAAGRRCHADRRRHRSAHARLPPAGHDRRPGGGRQPRGRRRAGRPAAGRLRGPHRRLVRPAGRGRGGERRAVAAPAQRAHPEHPRGAQHRDLRLPETAQADLRLGNAM